MFYSPPLYKIIIIIKHVIGVSTGRGQNLVYDAGFQDVSGIVISNNHGIILFKGVFSGPIEVLRPLKDFSKEELSYFNEDFKIIGE